MTTSKGQAPPGSLSKAFGGFLCGVGLVGMVLAVIASVYVLGSGRSSNAHESDLKLAVGILVGALALTIFGVIIQLLARIANALEADSRRESQLRAGAALGTPGGSVPGSRPQG